LLKNLLRDFARQLAFPKKEFVGTQSRLFRIPSDVANDICEMLLVANQTIEKIALPKIT